MTVPIACIPDCCGCVVCETDRFDRPLGGNINNTLTLTPYAGDVNVFTIIARDGADHAVRVSAGNALAVLNKDIVTDATLNYFVEIESIGLANGNEAGVLVSYLDAFNYYTAVVRRISAGNYVYEIRRKTGTGTSTVVATSPTIAFTNTRLWIVCKVNIQFDRISAWLYNEVGTVTAAIETAYSNNGGKRVGMGGVISSAQWTLDNFKYCEDHCPPLTCRTISDNFDRIDAPDINDNDSDIIWGYTVSGGGKWQIKSQQAWLSNGKNGTLNAGTERSTGAAARGTRMRFAVFAYTPGTVIGFSFGSNSLSGALTFGNSATQTPGELSLDLANVGGPTNKPAVLKLPGFYAGQTTANIIFCLNKDPFSGNFNLKVTVNTNIQLSVRTGYTAPALPWRFPASLSVSGNGFNGGVLVNTFRIEDTFDAGFSDSPACAKCDPTPCDICTLSLPHNAGGVGTYPNICGATYGGTWTNGVATNPAALHSISFNKWAAYGYLEFVWDWVAVAGDTITFYLTASGKFIKITALSPTVGCIEYFDGQGGSAKQVGSIGIGGGNTVLFTITTTEYGIFIGGTPFDPYGTSGYTIHSHQLGTMPTDLVQTTFATIQLGLHSGSYFKMNYVKYGRGATGYHPRNVTSIFPNEMPYCYSVVEACGNITDWSAYNTEFFQDNVVCTTTVTGNGEWWVCGGDVFSCVWVDGTPRSILGTYGLNTWSANTWWQWINFPTDYPTPNPGPEDGFFQAGAFMHFRFNITSNYGGGVSGIHGVGSQPEVRVSWNGGAGYLAVRQSKSPVVDKTVYIPEQPAQGTGEGWFELIPVNLGLPTTPIKFKTKGSGGNNANPFGLSICVGRGRLTVSCPTGGFPYYPLIDSGYSGDVTKWWMGTGNIDQTEWTAGVEDSKDHVGIYLDAAYTWHNRPTYPYEIVPPTDAFGAPANDCVDCTYPRPTIICPTRTQQITRLKIVVTGTLDNTRAWSSPDCNGGTQVGSCSWYNRIIILQNQNRQGIWNSSNDPHDAIYFAGYFPFGNPYPPAAPGFEACKNQASLVTGVIQVNPDEPTWYTIRVAFSGVAHGGPNSAYPLGQFYKHDIPVSSGNLCLPFNAKTIPWDVSYMPNPFPPVNVPSAGPGFNYPASWGCDMHLCTVTVEGLA